MEGCDKDLHSGVFGGSVHEAMTDLIALMGESEQQNSRKSKPKEKRTKEYTISYVWYHNNRYQNTPRSSYRLNLDYITLDLFHSQYVCVSFEKVCSCSQIRRETNSENATIFVWVSGSLVDKKGKILVPGMYDHVAELTEAERKLYEKIEFDLEDYTKDVGAQRLLHSTKVHGSVSVSYLKRVTKLQRVQVYSVTVDCNDVC